MVDVATYGGGVSTCTQTVLPGDGQMLKTIGFDERRELFHRRGSHDQFAQPVFGGNFPNAGGTDQNRVALICNRCACGGRKLLVVCPPPKQGVGIEQQFHSDSQAANSASGNVSKNAASNGTKCDSRPGRRWLTAGAKGINRA